MKRNVKNWNSRKRGRETSRGISKAKLVKKKLRSMRKNLQNIKRERQLKIRKKRKSLKMKKKMSKWMMLNWKK